MRRCLPSAWIDRFDRPIDRLIFGSCAILLLGVFALDMVAWGPGVEVLLGHDFRLNIDATARWLDGGAFYPANQLSGPFYEEGVGILYPPTTLLLFAPFAILPVQVSAALWWGLPAAAVAWQLYRLRPRPIVWPFLAICVAWPATALTIVVGNPSILFIGILALGTLHAWPAALIFLKPSVFPFALWGIRYRSWWVAAVVLAALSIPFGSLWLQWITVLLNSRIGGVFHSVQQVPLFLFPVIVWFGRSSR